MTNQVSDRSVINTVNDVNSVIKRLAKVRAVFSELVNSLILGDTRMSWDPIKESLVAHRAKFSAQARSEGSVFPRKPGSLTSVFGVLRISKNVQVCRGGERPDVVKAREDGEQLPHLVGVLPEEKRDGGGGAVRPEDEDPRAGGAGVTQGGAVSPHLDRVPVNGEEKVLHHKLGSSSLLRGAVARRAETPGISLGGRLDLGGEGVPGELRVRQDGSGVLREAVQGIVDNRVLDRLVVVGKRLAGAAVPLVPC